jgi:hypothetical protein
MSVQSKDILYVDEFEYRICQLPLSEVIEEKQIKFRWRTSNLIRGYSARWKIINNQLWLIKLSGYLVENEVGIDYIFPGQESVIASWYTGTIEAVYGNVIEYAFSNHPSKYHHSYFFKFENGILIRKWYVDNTQKLKDLLPNKFDEYIGPLNKRNQAHGNGINHERNEDVYTGSFKNGRYNGFGKFVKVNNDFYEGHFKDSLYSGFGKIIKNNELFFEGKFKNGESCGNGKHYVNGELIYSGNFKSGEYHGRGILKSGNKFEIGIFNKYNLFGKNKIYNPKSIRLFVIIDTSLLNRKISFKDLLKKHDINHEISNQVKTSLYKVEVNYQLLKRNIDKDIVKNGEIYSSEGLLYYFNLQNDKLIVTNVKEINKISVFNQCKKIDTKLRQSGFDVD